MKTLVMHYSPDLDCCTGTWLFLRYYTDWSEAQLSFVSAGKTLDNVPVDSDEDVIHVDTGLGLFDHHQLDYRTSASRICLDYLTQNNYIKKTHQDALERIVDIVTMYDNFGEIYFEDSDSDVYQFSINEIIGGIKALTQDDTSTAKTTFLMLDSLLLVMRNKVSAEKEIKKGFSMNTIFGKTLFLESKNDDTLKVALKQDFTCVIRKDPGTGIIRIKTYPDIKYDLTRLYNTIIEQDKNATWFLHNSKNMLLNGSAKNILNKPSKLTLLNLIAILKNL